MIDPLFDLRGKTAIITGGSRGLGYEIVKALASHGADCIIASRKMENCESVADEVRGLGRRALAVSVHAARWDELDRLVHTAYAEFERVDILVNNAGVAPAAPSHEVTEKLFDTVFGLNFKGPFRLAATVAARMAEGEGGSIINISSSGSMMPLPNIVAYGCAKAAMNALTRSLAAEYAPKVRVNAIAPGPILTDMAKVWGEEAQVRADNAQGKPGQPEDIVTAALFLASPASKYVTGGTVRVDGGMPLSI